MLDFFISPAYAQAAPQQGSPLISMLMPLLLIVVFYFLLIRPQMKRSKEHKQLLEKLAVGDEVVTSGGLAGKITALGENFVSVEIADNTVIKVQRPSISGVLPKGSLKSA